MRVDDFPIEEVEAFAFLKILGEQQEEYMPTDRYTPEEFFRKVVKLFKRDFTTCESCLSSVATLFCRQCDAPVCQLCYEKTHMFRLYTTFRHHQIMPLSEGEIWRREPMCEPHDEKVQFISLQDYSLLCRECVLTTHRDHKYIPIEDNANQARDDIRSLLDQVKQRMEQLQMASKMIGDNIPNAAQEYEVLMKRLYQRAEELQKAVLARKEACIKEAKEIKNAKIDRLRMQDQLMAKTAYGLHLCAIVNERILELGNDFDILRFYREQEIHLQGALNADCPIEPIEDHSLHASVQDLGDLSLGLSMPR
jgi:hypothetical protein